MYRHNFEYRAKWQGEYYAIKQVAPVVVEAEHEIVVVIVYTFYSLKGTIDEDQL